MALNPQPYLSDSTDEYLIDALPAIASGLSPWEVVMLSFASATPEEGDDCERILGFLQIWLAQPELIKGYWIPMLQDSLRAIEDEADDATDPEESEQLLDDAEAIKDQILGFTILSTADSEADFGMSEIGLQLATIAKSNLPQVREDYGDWFADQRSEALDNLIFTFSGTKPVSPSEGGPLRLIGS